jgi:peptide/nickel transport system substrate-binding protein
MRPEGLQVLGTYKNTGKRIGLILTALALAAGACEGPPARSKPWRHAGAPAAKGTAVAPAIAGSRARLRAMAAAADTLTVWLDGDVQTLDPRTAPTVWTMRIVGDTVFESLVRYRAGESEDQPGGYEPRLARAWRVSSAGRELELELEPDVRFHDGRPLSPADVVGSIDAARRSRERAALLADVAGVDAVGPRSVRVRLARASSYALRAIAEVPIMPAPRGRPTAGAEPEMIGTGPYRVRAWRDGTVELERFAGYRGPPPAVANIVFRYQPDAAAALRAARGGEIDVIPALIREHHPEQGRVAAAAGLEPLRLRPATVRYLALNARHPPLDDPRVRCALVRQIDRPALVAASEGLSRAVGGVIWPGGPGDGPAMETPPHDPAGAAALLDEAGWTDPDRDGVRGRSDGRLLLTVLVTDQPDDERDRVLDQLRAAGVVLDLRIGTTAVLDNRLRDGKFDAAFVEWRAVPGEDLMPVYGTGGALNFGGFSDRRVDAVLARLRASWDPAVRWSAMRDLGALLAETCPVAPLVAPDPHGLISMRVRGARVRGGWLTLRDAQLGGGR